MSTSQWALSVIPVFGLILAAFWARVQLRSWLAPSAVFCMYWAVALLLPMVFAPDFQLWPGAAWLILVLGIALHIGVCVGAAGAVHTPARVAPVVDLRVGKPAMLTASVLVGAGGSALLVTLAGFGIWTILSQPELILSIGRYFAGLRYEFGENPPVMLSILNGFLFFSGCVAGVWLVVAKSRRERLLALTPVAIGILQSFLVSARSGFMWLLIFISSTYLATLVLHRRHTRFVSPRRFLRALFIAIAFVAFYIVVQVIREDRGFKVDETSLLKARVAALGPPMSFSHWLRERWADVEPAWGLKTFAGLFDFTGVRERGAGLGWEEDLEIPTFPNVYTAFRQFVEDFTVPGTIVLFVLLGLGVGRAYREVLAGSVRCMPCLALFYAITLGSYLANWLNYNSCILGWAMFGIIAMRLGFRPVASATTPAAA